MSTDDGGRRPYNRPRRYPVPGTSGPDQRPPDAPVAVTRQNPTLAEAAQDHERRHGPVAGAPAHPYPADPHPGPYAAGGAPTRPRTVPTRALLIGVAVLVVVGAIGLVVGTSGGTTSVGTPSATAAPTVAPSAAASATAVPSTAVPATTVPPTTVPRSAGGPGADGSAAALCARLGAIAPFRSLVTPPRPVSRMPASYPEPAAGIRVSVCLGRFRPGAGTGRGQLAYLAEYQRLPAARYAAALTALGWVVAPALPPTTFRRQATTVTLVQQGTTLVTVVGTGG